MTYQLLVLDIDGTLVSETTRNCTNEGSVRGQVPDPISRQNEYWILTARGMGIETTLATGRHRNSALVKSIVRQLDIRIPIVTSNGSEVWDVRDGKVLLRHQFSADAAELLYHTATRHDVRCIGFSSFGRVDDDKLASGLRSFDWIKFVLFPPDDAAKQAITHELQLYGLFELASSTETNIEVNPHGVSKVTGIREVCRGLEIDNTDIIAIGDGFNDYELISYAGLGVAMGNAPPEVQRIAKMSTDICERDGVAKAIEMILSGQKVALEMTSRRGSHELHTSSRSV